MTSKSASRATPRSPLLTRTEAAARLRIAPRTLDNWRYAKPRRGPLPSRSGGKIVYATAEVEAYIKAEAAAAAVRWSA